MTTPGNLVVVVPGRGAVANDGLLVDQEIVEGAGLPQLGVDFAAIGIGLEAVLSVVLRD